MQVKVKDLAATMELGNNGIALDVYDDDGSHLDDLRIGRGTIEWCQGRTHSGNGKQVRWRQLIDWFENQA